MNNNLPKLVRDKIPDIIRAGGQECEIEILSDEDYIKALDAKLDEEVAEYHENPSIEELVDLLEVILAITRARDFDINYLNHRFVEKAVERGSFKERILLKKIYEKEK